VFLLVIAASLGALWPAAILGDLPAVRRPFTNFSLQEALLEDVFPGGKMFVVVFLMAVSLLFLLSFNFYY